MALICLGLRLWIFVFNGLVLLVWTCIFVVFIFRISRINSVEIK